MWHLVIYSVKASLFLAMSHILFRLLLRKGTLHRFNRIVLLLSVVISLILPACVFTRVSYIEIDDVHSYRESLAEKKGSLKAQQDESNSRFKRAPIPYTEGWLDSAKELSRVSHTLAEELFDFEKGTDTAYVAGRQPTIPYRWRIILSVIFIIGAIASLIKLLISTTCLLRKASNSPKTRLQRHAAVVIGCQDIQPCSWFKYVFISKNDYNNMGNEEVQIIISHETAHIKMHHSADLLLVDLATALQWYNPAIWLLRRDLAAVHEYEADQAVLAGGTNLRTYQHLLFNQLLNDRAFSISNCLMSSSLKSRILMMLSPESHRGSDIKAIYLLFLVPLFIIFSARVDSRVALDKNAVIEGFDWSIASLTTNQFLNYVGRGEKIGDVIRINRPDNRTVEIQNTLLAGKNVAILVEDGHRLSSTGGGMVKVDTRMGGNISEANCIWRPKLSLEEHFYIAKKPSHGERSGSMMEITRPSFEREIHEGANRKVLLSLQKDKRIRHIIIFE